LNSTWNLFSFSGLISIYHAKIIRYLKVSLTRIWRWSHIISELLCRS